jgi:hypothetical protein
MSVIQLVEHRYDIKIRTANDVIIGTETRPHKTLGANTKTVVPNRIVPVPKIMPAGVHRVASTVSSHLGKKIISKTWDK